MKTPINRYAALRTLNPATPSSTLISQIVREFAPLLNPEQLHAAVADYEASLTRVTHYRKVDAAREARLAAKRARFERFGR